MKIEITFNDGTSETVEGSHINIADGAFHISERVGIGMSRIQHVASYPLSSIKRWVQKGD